MSHGGLPTPNTRLLSPMKRRIYPNAKTGAHISTAGALVKNLRTAYSEGEADPVTWQALKRMGWTDYNGPAVTDDNGYIVAGSDPGNGL